MKTRLCIAAALALLLVPTSALAKGASKGTITGPGLAKPIQLTGIGEPGSAGTLGRVAEHTGFFAVVFGASPEVTLAKRPTGELGPRYLITYVMPGPNGADSKLVQELYPYAAGGPVSYMPAGQTFWDGQRTHGGWYVGGPELKATLVEAGLPARAPGGGSGSDGFVPFDAPVSALLVALALVAIAGASMLVLRRRPRLAPR